MTAGHVPSAKEEGAMLRASAEARFKYFVNKVAGFEEAWGLRGDNGWVSLADEQHAVVFALWPAERYAALAAIGEWEGKRPTAIPLNTLITSMLPAWHANGVPVSVFWVPSGKGVLVPAMQLREALIDEANRSGDEYG